MDWTSCRFCPRECGVDRTKGKGACGCGVDLRVARAGLHFGEEPCISGTQGSGTVFFSGCSLGCCFCQNAPVSCGERGIRIPTDRLSEIFLELQTQGAHNINLVTPSHFLPHIVDALSAVHSRLRIPVVYNTGGYERVESLRKLDGLVQVYLPDLKYFSTALSARYSGAADYFTHAILALREMYRQTGSVVFNENGMLCQGVLVRHLVLPGCRWDSVALLEHLARLFPTKEIRLSLMAQYTPCYHASNFPEINRKLWTAEYQTVAAAAVRLGFEGYLQDRASASLKMTPKFDGSGVLNS